MWGKNIILAPETKRFGGMIKKWNRGRLGVCPGNRGHQMTFSICPEVREKFNNFCKEGGYNKSEIVNAAILSYIIINTGATTRKSEDSECADTVMNQKE